MPGPPFRERVHDWSMARPLIAAIVLWSVPCALSILALVVLADVTANPYILSFGIPIVLAAPMVPAAIAYSALNRERRSRSGRM